MKTVKKILALAVAMVMVLAMGVTVMAFDVTINPNTEDKGTHTYGAYQIFSGNLDAENGTLGNIVWGSGITDEGKTALGDAAAYAASITESNAANKAAELANYLATPEKTGSDKIEGLTGGYYLIKDETDPTGDDPKAQTKFILQVIKDTQVNVKSSVPTVEKKVQDDGETTWQDSADYDIGDEIPYQVTATIGNGIDNFDSYSIQFVDTMTHLTLKQNSWKVVVGDQDITSEFTLTENEKTYTWAATDIKKYISEGSKVVLTYTATLDEDAAVGVEGNPNEVVLKYDNNPNNSGKGTPGGETPKDINIVFTYDVTVNKVESDGANATKALAGAAFKLEKDGQVVKEYELGNGTATSFDFKGLDAGTYTLTETKTPAGYNTIDPITFVIEAVHEKEADNPKLTSLIVKDSDGKEISSFKIEMTKADEGETGDPTGNITTDVLNQKGSTLPSTGGIGTTIFYVVGIILVLGAGIVLVTKKRMSN